MYFVVASLDIIKISYKFLDEDSVCGTCAMPECRG